MKISFIIPAYNAENTLERCVNSVIADTKNVNENDIELLIVVNGCVDKTYDVALNLKNKNKIIKVFNSKKGVSNARNLGICESSGEKIIFVDSDDVWESRSLEYILKNLNNDLFVCSYKKDSKDIVHSFKESNTKEIINWMISKPNVRMQVWAKVFDSNVIKENKLLFNDEIEFSEDGDFLVRYLQKCKTIKISDRIVYRYMSDSISTMRSLNQNRINGYIKSMIETSKFISLDDDELKKAFNKYVLIHLNMILVHDVFNIEIKEKLTNKMKTMNRLLDLDIFRNSLSELRLKDMAELELLPEILFSMHFNAVGGV